MIHPPNIRFAGYAGLFNIPDADRDVIHKGAFVRTLQQRTKPLPLLWQHHAEQQIGTIERICEDERGLRVVALIQNSNCRPAHLLRKGAVTGLSFGYRARVSNQTSRGRELHGIDLFEISLVTHPLQYEARVHFVL